MTETKRPRRSTEGGYARGEETRLRIIRSAIELFGEHGFVAASTRDIAAHAGVNAPAVPVVANVVAGPVSDPAEIVKRLVEQVTGTVRWRESVAYMAGQGVTRFFEIGAGKVLSGLVKRIADGAVGVSVGGPNDIAAAKDALAASA